MAHLFLSSVDPSNLAQLRLNIGRESERLANHVGGLAGTRHGRTVYKEAARARKRDRVRDSAEISPVQGEATHVDKRIRKFHAEDNRTVLHTHLLIPMRSTCLICFFNLAACFKPFTDKPGSS